MYSHLDDTDRFVPSAAFRNETKRRARRLKWGRRVLGSGLVALLVIGTGALYVARKNAAITRVHITTSPSTDGATNILLVGDEGQHADTLVIVRFETDGSVRSISIPRDLWNDSAQERVSAAYERGAQAVVDSVEAVTRVPIDHYIEIDMQGFVAIANELGGLPLAIDVPMRDQLDGLDLAASNCTTVNGTQLLTLVRSRHFEYQDSNGVWQADPTADLGRIERTHALMAIALQRLAHVGVDPLAIDHLAGVLADHATLDRGLGLRDLVDLGRRLARATATSSDDLPVATETEPSGAAVLVLTGPAPVVLHSYGAPPAPADTVMKEAPAAPAVVPFHAC